MMRSWTGIFILLCAIPLKAENAFRLHRSIQSSMEGALIPRRSAPSPFLISQEAPKETAPLISEAMIAEKIWEGLQSLSALGGPPARFLRQNKILISFRSPEVYHYSNDAASAIRWSSAGNRKGEIEIILDKILLKRIMKDLQHLEDSRPASETAARAAFLFIPAAAAALQSAQISQELSMPQGWVPDTQEEISRRYELGLLKRWIDSHENFRSEDFILTPSEYAYIEARWDANNITSSKENALKERIDEAMKRGQELELPATECADPDRFLKLSRERLRAAREKLIQEGISHTNYERYHAVRLMEDFLTPVSASELCSRWELEKKNAAELSRSALSPISSSIFNGKRRLARRLYEASLSGAENAALHDGAEASDKAAMEAAQWHLDKAEEESPAFRGNARAENLKNLTRKRILDSHLDAALALKINNIRQQGNAPARLKRHMAHASRLAREQNVDIEAERMLVTRHVLPPLLAEARRLIDDMNEYPYQGMHNLNFALDWMKSQESWPLVFAEPLRQAYLDTLLKASKNNYSPHYLEEPFKGALETSLNAKLDLTALSAAAREPILAMLEKAAGELERDPSNAEGYWTKAKKWIEVLPWSESQRNEWVSKSEKLSHENLARSYLNSTKHFALTNNWQFEIYFRKTLENFKQAGVALPADMAPLAKKLIQKKIDEASSSSAYTWSGSLNVAKKDLESAQELIKDLIHDPKEIETFKQRIDQIKTVIKQKEENPEKPEGEEPTGEEEPDSD